MVPEETRTNERISVAHDRVGLPDHLVRHPEVEIESRLILAKPEKLQRDGDGACLAIVDRGAPGRPAPKSADIRTLRFRYLQRAIGAALRRERHEFP